MTITKRPLVASAAAIDEFIGRAPDAGKGEAAEPVKRRKETISLGIDPLLLARVDAFAARLGISRAAAIAIAIAKFTAAES
ncbi:hypothetical protein [Caballeronia sp. DA-9]|uniref:hypothetical protein n=1 Tax=Caballeronia sp. DA-9 TaxID=3436237 RepID=UPI003F67D936